MVRKDGDIMVKKMALTCDEYRVVTSIDNLSCDEYR